MNIVDPADIYRIVAYTTAGGALVKLFDILLKWRSVKRLNAMDEIEKALKYGKESRDELKLALAEKEQDRRDAVVRAEVSDARTRAAENELRAYTRQVSMEQRARRHSEDDDQTARRHSEDDDQQARRDHEDEKP